MASETQDERKLDRELNKMIKVANQRMLAMEKETGIKHSFASKQLYDYLSSKPINAITKSGRISARGDYTLMQKKAIVKATTQFLENDLSKIRGMKNYVAKYSQIAGKKISPKMASTYYSVTHDLDWLYDIVGSEFWKDFAPLVKTQGKAEWVETLGEYIENTVDRSLKSKLEMLYDYLKNG